MRKGQTFRGTDGILVRVVYPNEVRGRKRWWIDRNNAGRSELQGYERISDLHRIPQLDVDGHDIVYALVRA